MPADVLFEQRWPVDEGKLGRARRGWVVFGLVIGVLGCAVMIGVHGWGPGQTALAAVFFVGIGALGTFIWDFSARMRRAARLRVMSDGTLEVVSLFKRSSCSFALAQCREVGLKKVVDHDEGPDWVYRYDLVVVADKKREFMLPGWIGTRGNQSTLSDEEAAAFHAAVSRFTTAAPG